MLMALAMLAVMDAAPPAAVEITLSEAGSGPVSALPRSLSDVARELRAGRKATGGFSAAETTVPRDPGVYLPPVEWEDRAADAEPEIVREPPQYVGVGTYLPSSYGGSPRRVAFRARSLAHPDVPRQAPRVAFRPPPPRAFQPGHAPAGHSRPRM